LVLPVNFAKQNGKEHGNFWLAESAEKSYDKAIKNN